MYKRRILIIKLGALGDVVMSAGAMHAIRDYYPHDHITVLTTAPMMKLLKNNPHIDDFIIDAHKPLWHIPYLRDIHDKLQGWDMVYDLQNNGRTSKLYYHFAGKPKWNGIATGCSHPYIIDNQKAMHAVDRHNDQLKKSGLIADYWPNITYSREDATGLILKHNLNMDNTVILAPGCSAHNEMKRWHQYGELATILINWGYQVVLLGTNEEYKVLKKIQKATGCINLCNKTSIGQLIDLTNKAFRVVGNDTGPMHIAAASGAKGVTIFGPASDPDFSAPRGEGMSVIRKMDIDAITPQEVTEAALIFAR